MVASTEARKFAAEHAQKLLGRLAFEINRVTKSRDAESVHGLRASLRKFSQTLRLFRDFFPGEKMHKIDRRVTKVMHAAQELRNLDTTLRLFLEARGGSAALRLKLEARGKECERLLVVLLKRWTERQSSSKWRAALQASVARSAGDLAKITVQQLARKATPGLAGKFLKRGREAIRANASLSDLQDCRTAAMRFRYALELLGPVSNLPLNAWLPEIKRVETMVGQISDYQAARDLVSSYPAGDRFDVWLKKRQRKAVNAFCQFWEETFARRVVNTRQPRRQPKKPPGRITAASRTAGGKRVAVA